MIIRILSSLILLILLTKMPVIVVFEAIIFFAIFFDNPFEILLLAYLLDEKMYVSDVNSQLGVYFIFALVVFLVASFLRPRIRI